MKKIITLVTLFLYLSINAQVAIGKETFRSKSSIIEFNDMAESNGGEAKGIILPILQDSSNIKEGALWVDAKTKKVMCRARWEKVALTDNSTNSLTAPDGTNEVKEAGIVISDGSINTEDPAILKLDSNRMALLLPHVNDVTKDISNPEPGTIAYDEKSKSLAVFNGDKWYFWN